VMSAVLRAGPVADIAIEDPPLEEVIAHIYQQAEANPEAPVPVPVSSLEAEPERGSR
jgi:hypothetical protein